MKTIIAVAAGMLLLMSCEKTYTCACSAPGKLTKDHISITAWNKGRAEVKCMQNNTASPSNSTGYYNCSLTATD